MKGCLARITQRVLVFAVGKRNADQPVHRRAHFADRVEFIVDDFRISIERLKQVAVESTKIAVDIFLLLNLPRSGRPRRPDFA